MMHQLSSWNRDSLKGKQVRFTVRWGEDERVGTIGRITATVVWIGCSVFSHSDLTSMREAN